MKTLIIYYSKSGNTRKVAEEAQAALSCDMDEIQYDQNSRTVSSKLNPTDYERVILMCPIWGFRLSEPMSLYLRQQSANIGHYRLAVTCGEFGLWGCISECKKILGTPPEIAIKIKTRFIKKNIYNIDEIIKQ